MLVLLEILVDFFVYNLEFNEYFVVISERVYFMFIKVSYNFIGRVMQIIWFYQYFILQIDEIRIRKGYCFVRVYFKGYVRQSIIRVYIDSYLVLYCY